MNNSNESLLYKTSKTDPFAHIYIEKCVRSHPKTEKILSYILKLYDDPDTATTVIDSYKDIFYSKNSCGDGKRALILSAASDKRVFPGAPVCQNFDEGYFYYASTAKNCIYDCEYCYLKGMYPTSHVVIDVDLQPVFDEVKKLLDDHPVYLCISYDTDLLALENLTEAVHEWMKFAAGEKDLRVECRTKCARTDLWDKLIPDEDFIIAFTISPQEIIANYEHGTPSLQSRINSVQRAMLSGHPVRLCFDPLIYVRDWKRYYGMMVDTLSDTLDWKNIRDISVGSFRISSSYLGKMRGLLPDSSVVQFPFELKNGVYQYPEYLKEDMQSFVIEKLTAYVPHDKIYVI